jgi:hypothetical protein
LKTIKTLISESNDEYSSNLQWSFDGLNNSTNYLLDLSIETYDPAKGLGMIIDKQNTFSVIYPELKVLSKPTLTELPLKSAMQIDWSDVCQNPATASGAYEYIDNFIEYDNTALNLDNGTTLTYSSSVIPANALFCFTIKLPKTYTGQICQTTDDKYKIGYDGTKQEFYTIINNVQKYSEVIKITENPFVIFILEDHIVIRQYNIYHDVKNCIDFNVSDMYNYPVAFMVQENN